MDARCSPGRVLRDHTEDQLPHFPADWLSAQWHPTAREPCPVQTKAGAMPADDRLGRDKDQRRPPARPDLSQSDPEEFVERAESRARSLGMKSKQLLT